VPAHAYTEEHLVEQPAIELFARLGWQTVSAMEEVLGAGGAEGTLGRESLGEVVLEPRLRAVLRRLNPALPPEAIDSAVEELLRDRSSMSLVAANREVYALLKNGIAVSVPDKARGGQRTERVRVMDWENPANNDFLLVSQLSIQGPLYKCRPDLVGFVNGLPFVVIELKKPSVPARRAFDDNLTSYKHAQNGVPALFACNAFLIASNGTDSRVGSLTADWNRFFEWKRIESENEPRRVSLEVMLRGTCDKTRLLDIVENFTLFSELKSGLVKIIGQNHQYLGVNSAIVSMCEARRLGHGRGGVFWQTQGSGKSFSMVFFSQKVLRKLAGNWTFVVVTDRVELDDQIAKTFKSTGAVSEAEGDACHAASGAHLRELLRGNHRYVFTLIHKFQTPERLTEREDIIVLTDESHRSQYDTLAVNMRAALPKATFLAFTGTPLIAGEEARTKEVFGDYVSIYDFQQSVEDGATVPLFYENRTPELQLTNPDLNEDIYALIEAAELDPEQEARLERELSRQYHILTRDDRLESVAKDIVRHFLGRGFIGKAMVVSIDKATALRMHDKVRKHWTAEQQRVENEIAVLRKYPASPKARTPEAVAANDAKLRELQQRLRILKETDMALVVSPAQNEIEQMNKLGLDIVAHHKRLNDSKPPLDEKFKDPTDPLRLVFVCAMWLTGFDAPSCSTLYLDKPMRNHALMQTIARANRVFPGKQSGIIVDYANVFASLEKALAIYAIGSNGNGETPIKKKSELADALRNAIAAAVAFCAKQGVDIAAIETAPVGSVERLDKMDAAVNALISPDALRGEFLAHQRYANLLYNAVKPDPSAVEFAGRMACLTAIAESMRAKLNPNPPDISGVMEDIQGVLDDSISGISIPTKTNAALDLSKIDFEALARQFKKSKTKNTDLEVLKAAVRAQLEKLVRLNRTRTDYLEKFEELIDSYNNGSRNVEDLYAELLALSRALGEEEQRHVRENLTEEELVIFDILTRPAPELTTAERAEVKKVAHELLTKLQRLLVLNWKEKTASRAQIKNEIENTLDNGLPRAYTKDLYQQKCAALFEHVYENYKGEGRGTYSEVA